MSNIIRALLIAAAAMLMPSAASSQSNPCGLILGGSPVFCDTFDAPNPGIPSRTGGLDPNVWGVSRAIGAAGVNFGQQLYNAWPATALIGCSGTTTVLAPSDVAVCNGRLREASNDNPSGAFDAGDVTVLAMYPKQPFDFAGRTGTVSFDVSNDTHAVHAAWPEFWMSDLPVPAPFSHFDSWQSLPANGFGVRFAAQVGPGQFGLCPNGNNLSSSRWSVDSAVVVRNYVMEDVNYQGVDFGPPSNPPLHLSILDCVTAPADGSGVMNHVEIKVSQGQIDVYATDAGVAATPTTLRKIASITNANLSFTRGLIWLEDVHYNADKGGSPSQRQHTFVWDNVAFDGPFTYRDFSYDALDANAPVSNFAPNLTNNLGKFSGPGQSSSWNVLGMPASPNPAAVRVLFNFFHDTVHPTALSITVNGHAHSAPWPYPADTANSSWRTFALSIPVTDLVTGTNVVQLGADQQIVAANVNIVLVNVPGGVPVLPGSNNTYPAGGTIPVPVNGACGSANGTTVPTVPTANLCSAGTASSVAGSGPWTWTCAGANGGSNASCSANKTAAAPTCTLTIAPLTFPQGQASFSGSTIYSGTCP